MRPFPAITAIGATVLAVSSLAGPAFAEPTDAHGWWSATNRGVPIPAPPDVSEDALLVQGISQDAAGHQAIAAVRIDVPAGRSVTSLRLTVERSDPATPAVIACPTTGPWQPAGNGPWDEAPTYDCEKHVAGELDVQSGALVFAGIGDLTPDASVSVALVPAGPVRIVLAPPDDSAFTVTAPPAPATGAPTPSPTGGSTPVASPVEQHPAASARDRASTSGTPFPAPAAGPTPSADVPADEVAADQGLDAPLLGADQRSAIGRTTSSGVGRASEKGQQLGTALVLFGLLGAFASRIGAGGGRLRPAEVPWTVDDANPADV